MIKEFLFEATSNSGIAEQNAVVAVDIADAKLQLGRMGYSAIRVLSSNEQPHRRHVNEIPNAAAVAVQSRYDSIALAVAKSYGRNWKTWAPGIAVLGYNLVSGTSPWIGGTMLLFGLGLATAVALPMVLYQQVQFARAEGRWAAGLRYVAWLRKADFQKAIAPVMLDADRAKMLAGAGQLQLALDEFSQHADTDRAVYLVQLAAIYDCAGQKEQMIATQRLSLADKPDSAELRIDLAWSLVRYTDRYDEARALMAEIDENSLGDLARLATQTVHALLAQQDRQHDQALAIMINVDDDLSAYANPLLIATRRELHGYMALSLKALGQRDEADRMWRDAVDLLRVHHHDRLIASYG